MYFFLVAAYEGVTIVITICYDSALVHNDSACELPNKIDNPIQAQFKLIYARQKNTTPFFPQDMK